MRLLVCDASHCRAAPGVPTYHGDTRWGKTVRPVMGNLQCLRMLVQSAAGASFGEQPIIPAHPPPVHGHVRRRGQTSCPVQDKAFTLRCTISLHHPAHCKVKGLTKWVTAASWELRHALVTGRAQLASNSNPASPMGMTGAQYGRQLRGTSGHSRRRVTMLSITSHTPLPDQGVPPCSPGWRLRSSRY